MTTGWSNGNSFSAYGESTGTAIGSGPVRWPFAPWRCFGLRQSDDRGSI